MAVPGTIIPLQKAKASSIFVAHFEIVHGCQLRCVGCPNSTLLPKVKPIPVEDFARGLANIDVERIHTLRLFNFGEPLLHPELSEIVAQIPKQKWAVHNVEISTNAQHVYWDDFEEAIKQGVITRLVVSCDGDGTPESYEELRPPATWDGLIEFLERASELRNRYAPQMKLGTRTICEPEPAEHRERWRALLEPLGWVPEFRRWQYMPESKENMTKRIIQVPAGACLFLADASEFPQSCWDGEMNLLAVDTDGSVRPCCFHPDAGTLGNLFENRYNEILYGRQRAEFVEYMKTHRRKMRVCGECDVGPVGAEGPSFLAGMDVV